MVDDLNILFEIIDEIESDDSGIYNFYPIVEELVVEIIEEILREYNFHFEKQKDGKYKILKNNITNDVKKKVIDYFNQNIKEQEFNKEGELYVDALGLYSLDPLSIIQIVKDMGYNCFMDYDGKFVVLRHPDYQNL